MEGLNMKDDSLHEFAKTRFLEKDDDECQKESLK